MSHELLHSLIFDNIVLVTLKSFPEMFSSGIQTFAMEIFIKFG